jgi:hypothetical protein
MSLDLLIEALRKYDEVMILELLEIDTDQLISRFKDKIHVKRDELCRELEVLPSSTEEEFEEEDEYQIDPFTDWMDEEE